ncbi:MAG: hypothetical protein MJ147_00110 [Clostridia bacterium]|nr:hypothetical protein [Clostridia bacterium]
MALIFSRVIATNRNEETTEFLVSGSVKTEQDLIGWTAFDEFVSANKNNGAAVLHIETRSYGAEEPVDATVEEVAYLTKRMEMRSTFLENSTELIETTDMVVYPESI